MLQLRRPSHLEASNGGQEVNDVAVFYSWQSDLPKRITRNFIERSLEIALKSASAKLHVKLILDQDAREERGSPNIPDTIQEKIRNAAVLVADLSIVAQRREGAGGLPNGCVSIEWGWAEESLGSEALIGVMNNAYGEAGTLPVDIRQNLVRITYVLNESSSDSELKAERDKLAARLAKEVERSIRARFFYGFHEVAPQVVEYLVRCAMDVPSQKRFAPADIASEASVSEDTALAVMEDLIRYGLATEAPGSGFVIRCLPSFYVHFDPLFKDWNADQDAVTLARKLLECGGQERVDRLSQELGWTPRQINPAVFRLLQGFAQASDEVPGASPFYRVELRSNVNTRALAEGRASLPSVAPRAQFRLGERPTTTRT
jgi:hypothetical protein